MVNHKSPEYLYRKDGAYYFSRRVPVDLQDEYQRPRASRPA